MGLFKKNASGFTLVEMIITIGIMGILAVIAITSMTGSRAAAKVEAAQKEVESEIALAKAYALQGKTQNDGTDMKTPCGYGVYFSSDTEYFIFYNFPAGAESCGTFNSGSGNLVYNPSTSGKSTVKTLSGGVTASNSDNAIYFTVPNANVYNAAGASFGADLTINLAAGEITKNVTVNKFGQITIGK